MGPRQTRLELLISCTSSSECATGHSQRAWRGCPQEYPLTTTCNRRKTRVATELLQPTIRKKKVPEPQSTELFDPRSDHAEVDVVRTKRGCGDESLTLGLSTSYDATEETKERRDQFRPNFYRVTTIGSELGKESGSHALTKT